jgi:hypothetical protein
LAAYPFLAASPVDTGIADQIPLIVLFFQFFLFFLVLLLVLSLGLPSADTVFGGDWDDYGRFPLQGQLLLKVEQEMEALCPYVCLWSAALLML